MLSPRGRSGGDPSKGRVGALEAEARPVQRQAGLQARADRAGQSRARQEQAAAAERARRQAGAARARSRIHRVREAAGIRGVSVPIPPPRYRRLGEIGRYPTIGDGNLAAARGTTTARPSPEVVTLSPPPHVVRQQVALGLPTRADLIESVAGALGGAIVTAAFVTLVTSPGAKVVAAALTGGLGMLLASTSPVGTIPSEIGMGATAASGAFLYFDLTGQVKSAAPVWRPASGTVDWRP